MTVVGAIFVGTFLNSPRDVRLYYDRGKWQNSVVLASNPVVGRDRKLKVCRDDELQFPSMLKLARCANFGFCRALGISSIPWIGIVVP